MTDNFRNADARVLSMRTLSAILTVQLSAPAACCPRRRRRSRRRKTGATPPKDRPKDYSNAPIVVTMMAFDKNKDGKLTKDEITDERLLRLFDQADTNKDGVVTKEELMALAAKLDEEAGPEGGAVVPAVLAGGPGRSRRARPRRPAAARAAFRRSSPAARQVLPPFRPGQAEADRRSEEATGGSAEGRGRQARQDPHRRQKKQLKEMRAAVPAARVVRATRPGGRGPGGPGGPVLAGVVPAAPRRNNASPRKQ